MCIGTPMKISAISGNYALCDGRGEHARINTALVPEVAAGDWVLVFQDSAREHISAQRAQEINATLDLMLAALQGPDNHPPVGFVLPSALSHGQLALLCGATP